MTFADNSKGCIVQGVHDVTDPAVSVYAGGDVTYTSNAESEGSTIVEGSVHKATGRLAGRVLWGMGFIPPANATMLAVGGNLQGNAWVGGNTRIGGKLDGQLQITTKENLAAAGPGIDGEIELLPYPDQHNATITNNLGKSTALKVDTDGDGNIDTDYNGYTAKTLIPLSTRLNTMPTTGTVTFGKSQDELGHVVMVSTKYHTYEQVGVPLYKIDSTGSGLITFTGDGQPHTQVFSIPDFSTSVPLEVNGSWDLAFNNIPDGQAIVINITKSGYMVVKPGWRIWVNGQDYTTAINKQDASLSRFRSIASRIMWNFPNLTELKLDSGVVKRLQAIDHWENGKPIYRLEPANANIAKGVLFPGSILLPHGNLYDLADSNGRILVGNNITFEIWEHHNAPWIGFDEPQCFTINGKTTASIS